MVGLAKSKGPFGDFEAVKTGFYPPILLLLLLGASSAEIGWAWPLGWEMAAAGFGLRVHSPL
jgi:hypothetical protein